MKCYEKCQKNESPCDQKKCRFWLDYESDLNCTIIAIDRHGSLTLREVGKRLSLSFVRIKQIQDRALKKLQNKVRNIN